MDRSDFSGFRRFWEVRVPLGPKGRDGQHTQVAEGFLDMKTGHTHLPDKGWNGEPPTPDDYTPAVTHLLSGSDELWESLAQKAIEDAERDGVPPPKWTLPYKGETNHAIAE